MHRVHSLFVAALLAAPAAHAAPYAIDAAHTNVGFKVKHMMVSWVRGEFRDARGTVDWDPAKPEALRIEVTVPVGTVDTDEPKRDEHLRSADFFDVATYPEMTFKSSKVTKNKDGTLAVAGDLTIRGKTKPVTFQVEGLGAPIADPWGNHKVGASATATINRQDFGVQWNKSLDAGGVVVGDEVQITLDVELNQVK